MDWDEVKTGVIIFLIVALLFIVMFAVPALLYTIIDRGACAEIARLQPELQPTWKFWNGCMITNPYTGYLQGLSDWSKSQQYLNIEKGK